MPMKLSSAAFCLGLLALSASGAQAQGTQEVIVRQGDTIEWYAISAGPHGIKFGADGATPVNQVDPLLQFSPRPDGSPGLNNNGESLSKGTGLLLTAKVKADAAVDKTFIFVCAVHGGAQSPMLSRPFKIAASVAGQQQTHKIIGVTGLHWALHVDTTPPPPPQ